MAATLTQAGKTRGAYKEGSKADVLKEIELGVPRSKAPGCCNVSRDTFYRWLEVDPDFRLGVEFAEARLVKRRLIDCEVKADAPYKERPDMKVYLRLLEASASEFRSQADTNIQIGQIGNNTILVSDEKLEGIRKLREAGSARKLAKTIEAQTEVHTASMGKGNLAPFVSPSAQLSLSKALLNNTSRGHGEKV